LLFPDLDEDAVFVRRSDGDEVLGTYSSHSFTLDGKQWSTVEHYFQAMKFKSTDLELFERIRVCSSPKQARKLGRSRFKKVRDDWPNVKRVVMTRAFYTKCRTHDNVARRLLETGERKILESSQYDYFWGCGRDRRGENTFGKVLMDVRRKLRAEQKPT